MSFLEVFSQSRKNERMRQFLAPLNLPDRVFQMQAFMPSKNVEALSDEELRRRSDYIRSSIIPDTIRNHTSFMDQILSIHTAHTLDNEHFILRHTSNPHKAASVVKDGFAGKMRSPHFPVELTMNGNLFLAASSGDVPYLMQELVQKAEALFPYEGPNPKVNKDTVYHYLSAIQYAFAIIHPFYDANGRTSEDIIYALWLRRPDLHKTLRYISINGQRNSSDVFKRIEALGHILSGHIGEWAKEVWGINLPKDKRTFTELEKAFAQTQLSPAQFYAQYNNKVKEHIIGVIAMLDAQDIRHLTNNKDISDLANLLKQSSHSYRYTTSRREREKIARTNLY